MSMNKNFDNDCVIEYTDNVINRGFEIYDEWIEKKHNSRKIVASAEDAVKLFAERKNKIAFIDALAYLFALDTRIKEKYNNILRCLFSYFSWRRETRALKALKITLNIPLGEADIRNAIAVELEKLADKLENEWNEEGDDDTHGGKRNGKAEEEAAAEEKNAEELAEETHEAEELADKEEKKNDSEQKEENSVEEATQEEAKEEIGDKKEIAEPQQNEAENTEAGEKEELTQEKNENLKEENNVSDDKSETITNKIEEAKTYNYAVDFIPLSEETISERSSEKTSLIDEMILDNIAKGDNDAIGYDPTESVNQNKEADRPQNAEAYKTEENKSTENDAHLYDKITANDKGETQQTEKAESTQQQGKAESTQQAEKVSEIKPEQPQETIQTNDNVKPTEQEFKPLSLMFQTDDANVNRENEMRRELSLNMTPEIVEAIKGAQAEIMREQLDIIDLNMNTSVEMSQKTEVSSTKQTNVASKLK